MIYVGKRYTCKVAGSVLKGAYCENCECEYVYRMERTTVGQGSSPYYLDNAGAERRAEAAAVSSLSAALKGVDAVPCPDCGWYQADMLAKLGGNYSWLLLAWICGVMAMFICFAIGFEPFLYSSAITALFFFLWLILRRNFKPNYCAPQRVGTRPRGTPEAILRSILEPKVNELEEGVQDALRRAFAEIDAAKAKLAGKFKPARLDTKSLERAEAERKRRFKLQLGAWTLSGITAFVVIGTVSNWKAEADAYAKATASRSNEYSMTQYLSQYPNSAHAQEIRDLRDDLHWETALSVSNSTHAAQPVRAYLSDAQHTRHRAEAVQKLKSIYALALQHAQELPKVDPDFANGIVAALQSQVDSEKPTITVSFEPVYKLEISDQVSAAENNSKVKLLLDDAKLKQELERNPSHNRVIGPGYAFDDSVTPQRNAMLRQHLQEIVDAATGDKVVNVVEVPKVEQGGAGAAAVPAQIRVKYLIHPSGKLVCYRNRARVQVTPASQSSEIDLNLRQETLNNMGKSAGSSTLRGFVRDYQIDWSISFNVKNLESGKTVEFSTSSFDDTSIDCVNPGNESVVYNGALQAACIKAYQVMLKKMGLH